MSITHATHTVADDDIRYIIDGTTRDITNLNGSKLYVMQFDHNSEILTFEMPLEIEGHDMSLCDEVKVLYINKKKSTVPSEESIPLPLTVDNDKKIIVFSWTLSENVTAQDGPISFQFKFVCHNAEDGSVLFRLYSGQYSFIEVRPSIGAS